MSRLSVILPFYDETAFVQMAVASIVAQGIAGCEVLIVNDNPDRFSEADLRRLDLPGAVRIISHDRNRGLSAARNTGIAASSGAVVGFLDSDDYYVANGLARQLALAESSGADLTHAQAYLSRGGSPALFPLPRDQLLFGQKDSGQRGLVRMEQMQFITSSWSSLYRRAFLDRCALRFDEDQTKFEDRLFVLHAVTAADRMACLAEPVRVWRRRAGSISTSATDFDVHRLQVQLLEKCLAHMRGQMAQGLPQRFFKRELFQTVSRLIWDMDLLDRLIQDHDPAYQDLAQRIPQLLGAETFHQQFFDDPVIRKISRIGQPSRRGRIDRRRFFALHAALRAGDFAAIRQELPLRHVDADTADAAARRALAPRSTRATPARVAARVILHLGMHKTGSTHLQGQLRAHRAALLRRGVLVPLTGEDSPDRASTRPGGFAGHQGLLTALRRADAAVWSDLATEVRASGASTVLISCENMLLPFDADRDARIADLLQRLSQIGSVQPVAFVRRPDHYIEALWREMVGNGRRAGARTIAEFLVDYRDTLTDLPALFAPFELGSGRALRFADFDARVPALWPAFLGLCGINGGDLPESPGVERYPTPPASQIALARLANAMIPAEDLRIEVLQALFRLPDPGAADGSFLPPQDRLGLVERFCAQSADWAAARGYAPDVARWRQALAVESWQPPPPPDAAALERLIAARILAERPMMRMPQEPTRQQAAEAAKMPGPELTIRLRPRPWLAKLLQRLAPRKAVDQFADPADRKRVET